MEGVRKRFGGVQALDGVDLEMAEGEVLALVGENGAGKSTLMNILVGLVRPDGGSLHVFGKAVDLRRFSPARAADLGIGMVHQHSALVPAMTVEENLAFGDPDGRFLFDPAARRAQACALAEQFDLAVPLGRRTGDLSVGERQRAEIIRVLSRGARVLILDEPTAVLTPSETDQLFEALRRLRADGCAVVFISHKLAEVQRIADRVTVLRRGRVAAVLPVAEADARTLGRAMLGRDLPPIAKRAPATGPGETVFSIAGLAAPGITDASRLRDVALEVRAGEILGVAGIDGNGQREIEEVLAGVRRPESGVLEIRGQRVPPNARRLRAAGLAHLSGDRETSGLIGAFTIAENLILKGSYDDRRYFRFAWLDLEAARRDAAAVVCEFGIRPGDPDVEASVLSGGNAQKLAVARELAGDPPVLVAVNPTRGLDVGAARFVHEQLLERRDAGAAVLLISTELDEVIALSDRMLALVRGAVVPIPPGADRAAIGAVLLGEAAA